MVWAFKFVFVVHGRSMLCHVFMSDGGCMVYDDRNTGVTKLFSYTSCQLNLLDLYNSVLLLCTLIISFEIRLGMQGILSVPIIVHVFGQKDGEYDLSGI